MLCVYCSYHNLDHQLMNVFVDGSVYTLYQVLMRYRKNSVHLLHLLKAFSRVRLRHSVPYSVIMLAVCTFSCFVSKCFVFYILCYK